MQLFIKLYSCSQLYSTQFYDEMKNQLKYTFYNTSMIFFTNLLNCVEFLLSRSKENSALQYSRFLKNINCNVHPCITFTFKFTFSP